MAEDKISEEKREKFIKELEADKERLGEALRDSGIQTESKKNNVPDNLPTGSLADNQSLQKNPQISENKNPFPTVTAPAKKKGHEHKDINPLRTYEGDVANVIQTQKQSSAKIHLAEQKRKRERHQELSNQLQEQKNSKKRTFVLWTALVLIILGLGLLSYFYYSEFLNQKEISLKPVSVIAVESEKVINIFGLEPDTIASSITKEKDSYQSGLHQLSIVDDEKYLAPDQFIRKLNAFAPPSLLRSFGYKYLIGVDANNKNLFLLVTIDSFDNAYAGMLEWERTLEKDLQKLFGKVGELDITASKRSFNDEILENKDIRILYKSDNNISILYGFLDKKTLLITDSKNTYSDILDEFLKARLVR